MEDIENSYYNHAQRNYKVFDMKNLGQYHDLYIKSNTLLLADVFENFRKICLEIYELYAEMFLSVPGKMCLEIYELYVEKCQFQD